MRVAWLVTTLLILAPGAFAADHDRDGDGRDDAAEADVCSSSFGRDAVIYAELACENGDIRGSARLVRVALPVDADASEDADADGFPGAATVTVREVELSSGTASVREVRVAVDPVDDDATFPRRRPVPAAPLADHSSTTWWACGELPVVGALRLGADQQGVPTYVEVMRLGACVHRSAPAAIEFQMMGSHALFLSRTGEGPGQVPFVYEWSRDADRDGLPGSARKFTIDLSWHEGALVLIERTVEQTWDADDSNALQPLPTLDADEDQDGVPNGHEPLACRLEDPNLDVDGACLFGVEFTPPPSFTGAASGMSLV